MSVEDVVDLTDLGSSPLTRELGVKRRAPSDPSYNQLTGKEKKIRSDPLVELKGRKLVFRQDPYQRFIPRRRLINLEALLLDIEESGDKLDAIPEEFYDVIAMAGHELTSSSESLFLKHLKMELVKGQNDALTSELLSPLVSKLFTLKHYGFISSDFTPSASKLPATLQIRCWEVTNLEKYFPRDRIDLLEARRRDRESARQECLCILAAMDDGEKFELMKSDRADKGKKDGDEGRKKELELPRKDEELNEATIRSQVETVVSTSVDVLLTPSKVSRKIREGTATTAESSRRSLSPVKSSKMTPEEEAEARKRKEHRESRRMEREEKRQEKEERKTAKERQERKKEAAMAKTAQRFGAFFKAVKAPPSPLVSKESPAGPSNLKNDAKESDFARTFKPVVQRPNVEWAPINRWFSADNLLVDHPKRQLPNVDVGNWTPQDFLDDHLRQHNIPRRRFRSYLPNGIKTAPPHGTVADVWAAHEEAADPRSVLDQLRDKKKFPWKTLAFDQQVRPPYSGTFTKRSVAVGPRTPFAQDPIFDYSYDSGDDWQDDEGGEDVDDYGEGVEGEEDDDDDDGSEFDDWLDDTDDVVFETDADGDTLVPTALESTNVFLTKSVKKANKIIPKRVVKVTPYWRGPIWEAAIAEPIEGLESYRIQLLNDTPDSIDPFKYESNEVQQRYKATYSDTAIGACLGVRCMLATEAVAPPKESVVLQTQGKTTTTAPPSATIMPLGDATAAANAIANKPRPVPKTAFPLSHTPELLQMIEGNTKIFIDLISSLKAHFDGVATKAAIEAKIREVATREGKSKDSQWRVKAEAWTAAGIVPPRKGLPESPAGSA